MPFPVQARFLDAAEAALGVRFPSAYRARLAADNGGELCAGDEVWWLHPVRDDSDRRRLARTCNDVVRETRDARARPGFPAQAVAIAHNGAGDCLVFVPASAHAGSLDEPVWRWDHRGDGLERVADDFWALIEA